MTVHILLAGRPLCGFSSELPKDWPNDHRFVSHGEYEGDATCSECKVASAERDRKEGTR